MRPALRPTLIVFVLTALVGACASRTASPASPASGPPAIAQECQERAPATTSVDALVDSARVVAWLDSTGAFGGGGIMLLTLAWDEDGMPKSARELRSSIAPLAAAELVRYAEAQMWPQPAAEYARLWIGRDAAATGALRLRAGPTEYCPPHLNDRERVRRVLAAARRATRARGLVTLELVIDEHGEVVGKTLVGSSGNDDLDALALGMVGSMTYSPAHFEGLPVPARMRYEVEF